MKKYLFIVLLLASIVLLSACSATQEKSADSGENWFNPTPPEEIQLASGQLQFFEFSAVW